MALIFDKNYNNTQLLTTGNSWIVEFHTDDSEFPTHAEITISGDTFIIEPNPDGSFKFDLGKVFNYSFTANNFNDSHNEVDISGGTYVYSSVDTYDANKIVYFTIKFENSSDDNQNITYQVKKGIYNELDFQLEDKDLVTEADILLTPSEGEYYARIVDGQPFDIPFYNSSYNDDVTITNTSNGTSVIPELTKGVQRIFLLDGRGNSTTGLTLVEGWNRLSIVKDTSTNSPVTTPNVTYTGFINVFKEPSSCKTVLKWFNAEGGFSYYPFSFTSEDAVSKTTGFLVDGFKSFDSYESSVSSTGSSISSITDFSAVRIPLNDIKCLKGLISSPKVYRLYNKTTDGSPLWKEVVFKGGDVRVKQTGKNAFDFSLKTFNTQKGFIL